MKTIKQLLEARAALKAEYDELMKPLEAENEEERRELTEQEESRAAEIAGEMEAIMGRIVKLNREAEHEAEVRAAKTRVEASLRSDVSVTSEPKVYGKGSPNSFIADLVQSSNPGFTGYHDARSRMEQYEYQVAVEIARDTDEGKRAAASIKEARRGHNSTAYNQTISDLRARGNAGSQAGLEARAGMTAGSGSGGSFVTPVYFIQEWAPYRTPGRAFIDSCNKQAMPDYGLTIYIPAVLSDANVAIQSSAPGTGEGSAVTETDPTTGYLSANLQTEAGQVIISQQLLDRAGPNFAFDQLIFDQLTRDYNRAADQFVLAQALAGAGSVAYNASAWALTYPYNSTSGSEGASFYDKIAQAKSKIRTGAGVVMDPTHVFVRPERLELMEAATDTLGRPLLSPGYTNPYNAAVAGNESGVTGYEGDTGYKITGLPIFHDLNIPAINTTGDQAIVGALDEVYVWESQLVPRVVPQTYAQNLQVLLQVYAYLAVIPRYPTAIQSISGSAMQLAQF